MGREMDQQANSRLSSDLDEATKRRTADWATLKTQDPYIVSSSSVNYLERKSRWTGGQEAPFFYFAWSLWGIFGVLPFLAGPEHLFIWAVRIGIGFYILVFYFCWRSYAKHTRIARHGRLLTGQVDKYRRTASSSLDHHHWCILHYSFINPDGNTTSAKVETQHHNEEASPAGRKLVILYLSEKEFVVL